MKISIVTAVYNRKSTLSQTIESVQSQLHQKIEHIIQDGGSTDGSLNVIERLADHSTFLESSPDTGIYDAINKGISRAKGDAIGLLHSDDFYATNDVVNKVVDAFSDPKIDGVYGDLQYVSAGDTSKVIRQWVAGNYDIKRLRRGWMPPHPTVFLRRQVYEQFGLYNTSYKISADYDALLRYLGTCNLRMTYIPETLIKMRTGGESNKSFEKIIQKSFEDYRALRCNNIGGVGALLAKNFSKLPQFIIKNK